MSTTTINCISQSLRYLGCDEIITAVCPNHYCGFFLILRFNNRYMRLKLTQIQLLNSGPYCTTTDLFQYLQTEINEFLLTGKNEITDEVLKTDSTST